MDLIKIWLFVLHHENIVDTKHILILLSLVHTFQYQNYSRTLMCKFKEADSHVQFCRTILLFAILISSISYGLFLFFVLSYGVSELGYSYCISSVLISKICIEK